MLFDRSRSRQTARLCGLLLSLFATLLLSGESQLSRFSGQPEALPRPLACSFGLPTQNLASGTDLLRAAPYRMARTSGQPDTWWNVGTGLSRSSPGEPLVLTWSYVPDGTMIWGFNSEPSSPSNLRSWLDSLYPGGFQEWHPLIASVFQSWENLTGIQFVYEPNDDGANFVSASGQQGVRGDLRLAAHYVDGFAGNAAYAFPPSIGGEMVIDSHDPIFNVTSSNSLRLRNVIAHEIGHNLGLDHVCPANGTKLMEPGLNDSFSGPQFDDMLAAQRLYGDPDEPNDNPSTSRSYLQPAHLKDLSISSILDEDMFELSLSAGEQLVASITPGGPAYLRGPMQGYCETGDSFNARFQRDLRLELLAASGQTLELADAGLVGQGESLSYQATSAGTYYLRVSGDTDDAVQVYDLLIAGAQPSFAADFENGSTDSWSGQYHYLPVDER